MGVIATLLDLNDVMSLFLSAQPSRLFYVAAPVYYSKLVRGSDLYF
jgi:hypothetical protein